MEDFERTVSAAQGYCELGMHRQALAELESLGDEQRTRPEILEMRLLILMQVKKWKEALAIARRLCALAPQSSAGFVHAAFCLHELGRTAEARAVLLAGPPTLADEATFHYNLACYECALGNLESSRAHLEISFGMDKKLRE
ncbi:MAG: hypothetical protein QOD99_1302, partial [Chthoniobacter sp.]|nr:hypothetical protein [Chthoniobacter sp.]